MKAKNYPGYNRRRLTAIIFVMAANLCFSLFSCFNHRYPLGLAPTLFLVPGLLRELDLRSGRPIRRLGRLEWLCLIAGVLLLAVLPFLVWPRAD